ncbi:RluA family pseudouridine synthase [Paenibacillus chungangensis]|uniref:Pseudouridine synthase n=1 Tax=Paenibacillus chungangensis TaxID=696535 RepID=A0ABW3HXR9_9BACL
MAKCWEEAVRQGEWLELPWEKLAATAASLEPGDDVPAQPETGSHPHKVRQWLAASSLFPEKWVNRLFSVGGIRWHEEKLALKCFPAARMNDDPLYRVAKQSNSGDRAAVLYEDDYCLVLNKPVGMPVHGSGVGDQGRGTLDEEAARHLLACGDPLPVRHIHRLDDDTSGPVLYSKNDLAQLRLDEAMRSKAIGRRYVAVVHGRLMKSCGEINEPIGKDRHHPARRRVSSNGDKAITRYETVASNSRYSIVRLILETGRTHQIRVHMSHIGHPLLGDSLYGGSSNMLNHQALHGEELIFPHPLTGCTINVSSPQPDWLIGLMDHIDQV